MRPGITQVQDAQAQARPTPRAARTLQEPQRLLRPRTRPQASWQAGPPHLLGDLGHVQLVPELGGQPREAPGTGCGLPTADRVPIALQCRLLTPGHREDPAQLPGAGGAGEPLQEGRGRQQLLGVRESGWEEPHQEEPRPGPSRPQAALPTHCARAELTGSPVGRADTHHHLAFPLPCQPQPQAPPAPTGQKHPPSGRQQPLLPPTAPHLQPGQGAGLQAAPRFRTPGED